MGIEKLIEQYRQAADKWEKRNPVTDTFDLRVQDALRDAATALSTLQAENEKLKDQLYDGEGVNLVNYWMQQAKIEENGHRNCQAENEELRAELERMKKIMRDNGIMTIPPKYPGWPTEWNIPKPRG